MSTTIYNAIIPQAADFISNSQPQLLGNFTELNNQFGVDHTKFSPVAGTNGDGFHKAVRLELQAADPATSATQYALYTKIPMGGVLQLYMRKPGNGTVIQLSGPDPVIAYAAGQTFLPGGLIMKWANITAFANGATITFATPFPTTTIGISITNRDSGNVLAAYSAYTITAANFKIWSSAGPYNAFYVAIGF